MCFFLFRSVPSEHRAVGLGLQWVLLRLLGKYNNAYIFTYRYTNNSKRIDTKNI